MTKKEDSDKIFLDAIQGLRNELARMDRDLGVDRGRLENMAMTVSANTEAIKQLSHRLETIQNKVQDRVADAVAPMMEQADSLTTAIEGSKVIVVKNTPFYKKIFRNPFKRG